MKKKITLTESQLQKVVAKAAKRYLTESENYDQWKHELKMFMDGLRKGQAIVDDDTAYVQVFKGATAKNDPRYVYIKKGDNRLHDDHYYVQNSPVLSKRTLNAIYNRLGWNDDEEMYESKDKKIALTESQVQSVVTKSVKRILKEQYGIDDTEVYVDEKTIRNGIKEATRIIEKFNIPNFSFAKMARILISEFHGSGQTGEKYDLLDEKQQEPFYELRNALSEYSTVAQEKILKLTMKKYYGI